jgi:hypothetical protein
MTTRAEHLQWCKDRANEYVERGELEYAFNSMVSDLGKHDDTRGHPAIQLGVMLFMGGHLNTPGEMKKFIDGFN